MYQPRYTITELLLARISEAEGFRSKIQAAPIQVAWLESIRLDALVRRAHFSTAIEGNPLTLPEVAALVGTKQTSAKDRARKEVLNYFAALRWIARQPQGNQITVESILKLHRLLMSGLLPSSQTGAFKRSRHVIMSAGRVVYEPPGPAAAAPGAEALAHGWSAPPTLPTPSSPPPAPTMSSLDCTHSLTTTAARHEPWRPGCCIAGVLTPSICLPWTSTSRRITKAIIRRSNGFAQKAKI